MGWRNRSKKPRTSGIAAAIRNLGHAGDGAEPQAHAPQALYWDAFLTKIDALVTSPVDKLWVLSSMINIHETSHSKTGKEVLTEIILLAKAAASAERIRLASASRDLHSPKAEVSSAAAQDRPDDIQLDPDKSKSTPEAHSNNILSPRQLECLRGLNIGLTAKEIALNLRMSHNTVNQHLGKVYSRLGVRNAREAILAGRERGLI